jgi:membrane-associated phospholipid phosphatase
MLGAMAVTIPARPPAEVHPAPVAVRRGRGVTLLGWVGLAGFAGIFALVRAHRSEAFDLAMTLKLQRRNHPVVTRIMEAVSWPGFPPQSRIIPFVIAACFAVARLPLEAAFALLAYGTALVATATKALMRRPRPVAGTDLRVVVAPLGGTSFPSGHTITYMGVYGFLAYLLHTLIRPVALRRAAVGALVGLLALVGPSRVHQGHHWFTDVTASYLLGLSYLIGLTSIYRRIKARRAGVRP